MAEYRQVVADYNYLPSNAFKVTMTDFPDFEFLVQNAPIPAIQMPSLEINTRFQTVPYDGSNLVYDPLILTFIVDEDLKAYKSLYKIFKGLNGADIKGFDLTPQQRTVTINSLTSKFNPNIRFVFQNIVPIELGTLEFTVLEPDTQYLTCTVVFRYEKFFIPEIDCPELNL